MSDGFTHPKIQDAFAELDQTLRLVAHAPIPEGLEARVKARLVSAPRKARLLAWPARIRSDWMRTAAAAAIVAVVAGGGWGVYSHVLQPLVNNDMAVPIRALWTGPTMPGGGMSSEGAMRVPLTVNGPTVNHARKNAGKKHPSKLKSKIQAAAK
jgi:hypothetical protein